MSTTIDDLREDIRAAEMFMDGHIHALEEKHGVTVEYVYLARIDTSTPDRPSEIKRVELAVTVKGAQNDRRN